MDLPPSLIHPQLEVLLPYLMDQPAPAGYSLYQQGRPQGIGLGGESSCECGRYAYDGVEVLDGKIYFVGGHGWFKPRILLKDMILQLILGNLSTPCQ